MVNRVVALEDRKKNRAVAFEQYLDQGLN